MILDTTPLTLEKGVWSGPAQVVLADMKEVESGLREQSTTAWRNGWSEQAYDFPNTYVTLPIRWMTWDPASTFVEDQNNRFAQRYFSKNGNTFCR